MSDLATETSRLVHELMQMEVNYRLELTRLPVNPKLRAAMLSEFQTRRAEIQRAVTGVSASLTPVLNRPIPT